MGVKAVWGRCSAAVMGFSHGNSKRHSKGYYSNAKHVAKAAEKQPFFVTIGGGEKVPKENDGIALELVKSSRVYGETLNFIEDANTSERLSQWPVGVILKEVYTIENSPHLIKNLGFANKNILALAFDKVIRYDELILKLYEALRNYEVTFRSEICPPKYFRDSEKPTLRGSPYGKIDFSSSEGKKIWKLSRIIERDPKIKKAAKQKNRDLNHGILKCEACEFTDELSRLFDAHHLYPLYVGERQTEISHLAILCPTCHRWAHQKTDDKLYPVPISEISIQRSIKKAG